MVFEKIWIHHFDLFDDLLLFESLSSKFLCCDPDPYIMENKLNKHNKMAKEKTFRLYDSVSNT